MITDLDISDEQAIRNDERESIARSIEQSAKALRGRDSYTKSERQWLRDLARQIRARIL